jgi:hypothetical protein
MSEREQWSKGAHPMRRGLNILVAAGLFLTLSGCASIDDTSENNFLSRFGMPDPVPGNFSACYGYGCKYTARIALNVEEWRDVRAKFNPPPADASAERRQVVEAVARLERLVSLRTGTSVQQQHSRLNFGDSSQLDCIDDSVNTWSYLTMLAHDGLLRYHSVAGLAHRGSLLTLDFSNTAVLVEKGNGERFAVDPWLVDADVPPPVIPLAVWRRTDWPQL